MSFMSFLVTAKDFIYWFIFFTVKMIYVMILYDSAKTAWFLTIWPFSYCLKCSRSIRLKHYLINIILGKRQLISYFFYIESFKRCLQMQVAPDTVIFDWVRPVLSVLESDYNILGSAISLERTNEYLRFFSMEIIIKGS